MGYIFDAMYQDGDGANQNPGFKPQPHTATPAPSASLKLTDNTPTPAPAPVAQPMPVAETPTPVRARKTRKSRPGGSGNNVDERLVSLTSPASVTAEEYRSIRTGLLAKNEHRRHLVHTITSATPQEGKTITSLNLGLIFSELRNRKTLVIEADLRLPQFAKLLDLPESDGLAGVLSEGIDFRDAVQEVGENGLHVLCAGRRMTNEAVQLLSSPAMTTLLKTVRREYDHVIIDTPPVVELADAGILGTLSDDVILIARMNRTPRPLIDQAVRTLASYGAPVAGVIATDQSNFRRHYYYHRYGYRYRYHYHAKAA